MTNERGAVGPIPGISERWHMKPALPRRPARGLSIPGGISGFLAGQAFVCGSRRRTGIYGGRQRTGRIAGKAAAVVIGKWERDGWKGAPGGSDGHGVQGIDLPVPHKMEKRRGPRAAPCSQYCLMRLCFRGTMPLLFSSLRVIFARPVRGPMVIYYENSQISK